MVEKITEIIHFSSPIHFDRRGRAYVRGIDSYGNIISEELDPNDNFPSRDKSVIFAVANEVPFVEVHTGFRAFVLGEREKIADRLV